MEKRIGRPHTEPSRVMRMMIRIDRKTDRALAHPDITPKQESDLCEWAFLSKAALSSGNPIGEYFAREFIKCTDPFMIPEETAEEQI